MTTEVDVSEKGDPTWEDLAADWQAEGEVSEMAVTSDIQRKVRRQSWWLIATVAFETLLSVGLMGFLSWEVYKDPTAASWVLSLAVGLVVTVVWWFSMWNRKGTWRPVERSTRSFVEFSYLRAERKLQVIRYLPHLLVFELLVLIPPAVWRHYSDPDRWARFQATYLIRFAIMGAIFLGLGIFLLWRRGKILREMQELESLRRELAEDDS